MMEVKRYKNNMNPHTFGVILVILGNIIVSFDSLLVRLSGVSGWNTTFWFGVFMCISMSIIAWGTERRNLIKRAKKNAVHIFIAGIIMSGSATFFIMSVKLTLAANTVVIMSSSPIFSAVFAFIILREKTPLRTWVVIIISMIGIFVVVYGSIGRGNMLGDLMAVMSTSLASLNFTLWRKRPDVSRPLSIALGGLIIAVISTFSAAPFTLQGRSYIFLAAMGLLTAPLGRLASATATRFMPVAEVSLFLPLNTILAPIWVWVVVGEVPMITTFIGGGIIITTLFGHTILNMRNMKKV